MKNTRKVLSVVLAVVMVLSVLTMAAYAIEVTVNPIEQNDKVNIKFEVYQVSSADSAADADNGIAGGTYNAVDNDIYAVTVYAKTPANLGLRALRTCIKFDKTYFEPLMSYDEDIDELYVGEDFIDDYGSEGSLFVKYADRLLATTMWDASGNVVTKPGQAALISLGRSNAGTLEKKCEYKTSGAYVASNTSTQGVMLCELNFKPKDKGAYINTDNCQLSSDWLEMMTVYFQRQVAEDALPTDGVYFGINSASDVGNDCATSAANGNPMYVYADAPAVIAQAVNYVSNAFEAPVKALVGATAASGAKAQQIAFNSADSVDYRFIAQFSTTRFPIAYDQATEKITATDIEEVGFVMTKYAGDAGPFGDEATILAMSAADVAALDKTSGTYRKCWTTRISTDMAGDTAFAFSCRIAGIAVNAGTVSAEYIAVPYVIYSGQIYFGQAMQSGVQARYDAYHTLAGF